MRDDQAVKRIELVKVTGLSELAEMSVEARMVKNTMAESDHTFIAKHSALVHIYNLAGESEKFREFLSKGN